jgi:formate hydrogenlyase subunit 3/multisubunit Na+/H+ antiporter MnhD subunit
MPAQSLLLAPALLALAALVTWGLGLARLRVGREIGSIAAWLGLAAVAASWIAAGRSPVELSPGVPAGIPLDLRLDAVAFAFSLFILVPLALQFTFQTRNWQESGVAALAASAALVAVLSSSLVLTALGLGTAASLVMAQLRQEHPRGTEVYWAALMAAWLLLLWAGATLEAVSGTSGYGAVPVGSLQVPVFLLLAAAAVLCSGLLPWRTWVGEVWERPRLQAGTLALAILVPLGFYLLVRAYAIGAGHWPSPALNLALAALGTLTALAAGIRGQAARTRRGYLAEVLPLSAGLSLFALSLGTPLGVAAAVTGLAAGALVTALLPLLPDGPRADAWLGLAVVAGLPPGVVFAARLIGLEAGFEAGAVPGLLAIAAAGAWLLGFAGAARAIRLPSLGRGAEPGGSGPGTLLAAVAGLAGGALLGALLAYIAVPAAAEVVSFPVSAVGGGALAVQSASGSWPAVTLATPLLAILLVVALLTRPAWTAPNQEPEQSPAPLFRVPWSALSERAWARLAEVRLPADYRSLLDPALLESAASRPRPWLWAAIVAVLAFVVTR